MKILIKNLLIKSSETNSNVLNYYIFFSADQDLLKKQQDIIYLFEHITGRIPNEQFYNLGVNYDIEQYYGDYSEPHIVQYYFNLVKLGNVQPQGTAFSLSVSQLRKEVALLTRIFLSAKDYGVFIKTAAWARVHVNEYQFVLVRESIKIYIKKFTQI